MKINKKLQLITTELKNKITKDASVRYGTTNFKYMSLDNIYNALLPLLDKHDCVVYFNVSCTDIECYFRLSESTEERDFIKVSIPLIKDYETQKDKLKALGSALTYSKRYLLANLFNLVASEDHEQVTAVNNVDAETITVDDLAPAYDIPCRVCGKNTLNMSAKFEAKDGRFLAPCTVCKNTMNPNKKVWTEVA